MRFALAALLLTAGLAACAPKPPQPPAIAFRAASFAELPGYAVDRISEALPALGRSCARMLPRNARAGRL
jgi:membrane-bound lytic murein transglycosylase A